MSPTVLPHPLHSVPTAEEDSGTNNRVVGKAVGIAAAGARVVESCIHLPSEYVQVSVSLTNALGIRRSTKHDDVAVS